MRKKYLSALLFGALLFASAGTFTSCKDYDDDINNLQDQITANADAIKALQDLVNAGKYVSGVAMEGQTITFTFSDGSTQPITIPAGEKGQTVVVKDGELYIDDEATGIKVAEELDTEAGLVKSENGTWWVLNENGEYTNTNIPVSGITVSGSEKDGYTFTIYNEKGEAQTVKLPSAVSSITEMTLGKIIDNSESTIESVKKDEKNFIISKQEFTWTNQTGESGLNAASGWKGNKTIPNNGDWIFASPSKIDLRIDPVNVDASNIDFYLTNTNNADLNPVVLTATGDPDGSNPMNAGQANGRAAVAGNGLWVLYMENQVVADANENNYWTAIETAAKKGNKYVHAVNANHGFRSKYEITVNTADPESLTQLKIKGVEKNPYTITIDKGVNVGNTNNKPTVLKDDVTFKVGTAYKVEGVQASALYDMYLTADDSDVKVYQLTFDQDKHTFTIGKNPDVSTVPAHFDLIVYTVANDGTVKKTTITIQINTEISTPAEYSLIEHNVNVSENANHFGIDLAIMKTALGDNLDQWTQNVDLTATNVVYEWSEYEDRNFVDLPTGIAAKVVSELANNNVTTNITTDRNKANFVQVDVTNAKVDGLKLDKTYYIRVTFRNEDKQKLSQITVPVEFHAPALADLFTMKEAYVDKTNNVINAYFYNTNIPTSGKKTASTAVTLARYFSNSVADAKVSFTNDKVGETNMTGEQLFEMKWTDGTNIVASSTTNSTVYFGKDNSAEGSTEKNYTTINFDAAKAGITDKGQAQNGYGEVVTIKVNKDYYNNAENTTAGWNYTQTGDNEYSFKIRLMSPIYEGSVNPVSGNTINISANDWVNGARITDAMIKGADYNKNTYNVVPDKYDNENIAWANPQISEVTPLPDEQHLIKEVKNSPATYNKETKVKTNGAFVVKGENITNTTEVKMPVQVKDVWGYILEEKVSVTIQMNN